MPVTFTLVDTFTKLAVAKLPRLALSALMLPVKFAVLPASSRFTLRFGTTTLPLKFAVLPASSKFTVKLLLVTLLATLTKLACARLPRLALPESKLATILALLVNSVLVTLALPVTVKILLEESIRIMSHLIE